MKLLSRIIANARHGPRFVAAKVRHRLFPQRTVLLLFGLTEPRDLTAVAAAAGHEFRFARAEEVQRYVAENRTPWTMADVERLRDGARCLLQFDGDRLAGYTWVSVRSPAHLTDGVHLSLPADVSYTFKTFTYPEFRGRSFRALRTLEIFRRLQTEGRRRLLCYVPDTNAESLRGVRKSGAVPVGKVTIDRGRSLVHVSIAIEHEFWADLQEPDS